MHQLELLSGGVGGLMQVGLALQVGHHVGIAELLNAVDARHAADHLLLAELLQGLEVKMPKAFVLVPCLIITARDKEKEVRHLYMKHVKAVAFPVHLGEKTVASIPDEYHAILNLHS
jgi:hypothetical protein